MQPGGVRRAALCGGLSVAVWTAGCGAASGGHGAAASPTVALSALPSPSATAAPTPLPTPTATALPPPPSPTPTCTTAGVLATWTVQRLAAQTVVVPVDESNPGGVASEVASGAGGVILFGAAAPANLGALLAALARSAPDGVAPLVMTDEEGGAIQRMANLVGDIPSARQMGATMTAAQIQALATQAGQRMRAAGVTMDLAPVLDLDAGAGPSDSDPDGTRSFSAVESVAQADGLAFGAGLRAGGVVPVVKHFPGLGESSGNTDVVAASTLPWSTLQGAGLLPFTAAVRAGLPAVMVANATVPGLSALPASLSPAVMTTVLRGQLGFDGLVLTDSLSAVSVSAAGYSVPRAAATALAAGADMVMFNGSAAAVPSLYAQTVQAIAAAASGGALSRARLENAALHVLAAKQLSLC